MEGAAKVVTRVFKFNTLLKDPFGPLVAPGAPRLSVGGPMSRHGANVLEVKRKKFKSLVDLPSLSQYLSYLLCFDNDHPRGLFGARNGQKAKFFAFGAPFGPV